MLNEAVCRVLCVLCAVCSVLFVLCPVCAVCRVLCDVILSINHCARPAPYLGHIYWQVMAGHAKVLEIGEFSPVFS